MTTPTSAITASTAHSLARQTDVVRAALLALRLQQQQRLADTELARVSRPLEKCTLCAKEEVTSRSTNRSPKFFCAAPSTLDVGPRVEYKGLWALMRDRAGRLSAPAPRCPSRLRMPSPRRPPTR